jgi:hypothetical protein
VDNYDAAVLGAGLVCAICAVAALFSSKFRTVLASAAVLFLIITLVTGVLAYLNPGPRFKLDSPQENQLVSVTVGVPVYGSVDNGSDTIWIVLEKQLDGVRVWDVVAEVGVVDGDFNQLYQPNPGTPPGTQQTIVVIRADRECERQLGEVKEGPDKQRIVRPIGGCESLGARHIVIAG